MKQYLEERIAYLKNIEREKLNDIDNVPLGPLRTIQWDLIKEIGARKNELQNAVRWLETEQLNKPVVVRGGANEAVIVHGDNTITNDQSQTTTLTTPTEPLPAEGLAKTVSVDECDHNVIEGNVAYFCSKCGKVM